MIESNANSIFLAAFILGLIVNLIRKLLTGEPNRGIGSVKKMAQAAAAAKEAARLKVLMDELAKINPAENS